MIKQQLTQKQLQRLSPQQIQLMKLFQIPTAALEQRIKEELEANPALEEGSAIEDRETDRASESEDQEVDNEKDDFEIEDYLSDYAEDDPASYSSSTQHRKEEEQKQIPYAVQSSFHEHLISQLGLLELESEEDEIIAKQIIGSIDGDGYLRREPESIVDDLMFSNSIVVSNQRILDILSAVQKLEPLGTGARDLRECLLIQIDAKINKLKDENKEISPAMHRAKIMLQEFFKEFSKKHYHKLVKYFDISEAELKESIDEILKLNPKPASGYAGDKSSANTFILPDFTIINRDGELDLTLNNRNAPDLKISEYYQEMMQAYHRTDQKEARLSRKEKEALVFVKQKVDAAKWFVDAIQKRQDTMLKTMSAILQFQYDYFLTGDTRKLRPMILKDISDITGLDISTVSRVANNKFVQTEFGTKLIKEFFSEAMVNQDGEEVSTLEVKKILSDIIEEEDKMKPLSDEDLRRLLSDKGYSIARRTVAKYREQLNIPVARLRKQL